MKFLKRKQIVVLALVLMIVVAGYLQYSYKKSSDSVGSAGEEDKGKIGESVYVGGDDVAIGEQAEDGGETNYFAQAKLDREMALSRDTETLRAITEDPNADEHIKAEAFEKLIIMTENSQKEMKIETLIEEKGFNDALVFFGADGSVDVVVNVPTLTDADAAQIYDIVSRHAGVEFDKIHIKHSNKNTEAQ
ncbi:MAG TPA: SpoIIIAH-like family protein [Clostridiaceae bacterium]|nr:SpoIIIAH-like family protein [Clostridiaceae bacterium]